MYQKEVKHMNLNQVTVPAVDVRESVVFYTKLGLRLIVDSVPRYARFECPEGNATFSVEHASEAPEGSGVVVYFECDNLDETVATLKAKGIAIDSGPANQTWLWREARLRDPSGNTICLFYAGDNRRNPPWRIK
jgi:catechol 2,3-dioxygenase-like lactoylglutathione lyase family enzyme